MKKLEEAEARKYLSDSWNSEKMIDWEIKNFYFYQLGDGLVLEFRKKPSIDKTIYYDDETEKPKVTENYFIYYNRHNMNEYATIEEYKEETKPYFMQKNCNNKKSTCLNTHEYIANYENNLKWAKDKNYFQRYATKEEVKEYNEICEELKKEYIERLKKYYKRYNKNITTYGYWVNR